MKYLTLLFLILATGTAQAQHKSLKAPPRSSEGNILPLKGPIRLMATYTQTDDKYNLRIDSTIVHFNRKGFIDTTFIYNYNLRKAEGYAETAFSFYAFLRSGDTLREVAYINPRAPQHNFTSAVQWLADTALAKHNYDPLHRLTSIDTIRFNKQMQPAGIASYTASTGGVSNRVFTYNTPGDSLLITLYAVSQGTLITDKRYAYYNFDKQGNPQNLTLTQGTSGMATTTKTIRYRYY